MNIFVLVLILFAQNCSKTIDTASTTSSSAPAPAAAEVIVGAARLGEYLPMLRGKTVALVVNQTSLVGRSHLVDTLLANSIKIQAIFSPEHGFRGEADAGEKITDARDPQTGIPLLSLYGAKRKPSAEDLASVDWVIFDIQDVGARFYTYISTMAYVMDACAENGVRFMVLDRPNPNGHYVDGPIRKPGYESFVGLHAVPVVHGLTIGEYARLVNGEGWLESGKNADLTVIPCQNYDHKTFYELPVRPSPNLPDMRSIYLYPSTCFFEGTVASEGRGTRAPFQIFGHPDYPAGAGSFSFTPEPMFGARQPKLEGQLCHGYDLSALPLDQLRQEARINLSYLINFYRNFPDKDNFFLKNNWIDKLAGTSSVREQIVAGKDEEAIRAGWAEELAAFKAVRKKYLLYPDFE